MEIATTAATPLEIAERSKLQKNTLSPPISPLVCVFSEDESGDGEWAYESFPIEQIYVGSCIQTEATGCSNLGVHGSQISGFGKVNFDYCFWVLVFDY